MSQLFFGIKTLHTIYGIYVIKPLAKASGSNLASCKI